jgi:hypothetical protein
MPIDDRLQCHVAKCIFIVFLQPLYVDIGIGELFVRHVGKASNIATVWHRGNHRCGSR